MEYLTVAEAAEYIQVHPRTVKRWIAAGKLTAYRSKAWRGQTLLRAADVHEFARDYHAIKEGPYAA